MNYKVMTIRAGTYTQGYSAPRIPLTVAVPVSPAAVEASQRAFNANPGEVVEIVWDEATNGFLDEPILARPIYAPDDLQKLEDELKLTAV